MDSQPENQEQPEKNPVVVALTEGLQAWEKTLLRLQIEQSIIECAHDILADFARWTTGAYAQDAMGMSVEVWDPGAVKFCAIGAARKCARDYRKERIEPAGLTMTSIEGSVQSSLDLCTTMEYSGEDSIVSLNDQGHAKNKANLSARVRWQQVRKVYVRCVQSYKDRIKDAETRIGELRTSIREAQ